MVQKPKVLVLRTAGTNCDEETAFAFKKCGAEVEKAHINCLIKRRIYLSDYHILAIPGGFTYGDDIASGRILANEMRLRLGQDISKFIKEGKLIIGICNGFQVLVKAGFLPGKVLGRNNKEMLNLSTLTNNDSGKFEDRWTYLKVSGESPWTKGLKSVVYFPIAHGEGKFISRDKFVLDAIKRNGQVAFRYCTERGSKPKYPQNPNGSEEDIAGITDPTGKILGLMPHPERHFLFSNHPRWSRIKKESDFGDGAKVFQNGVNYVKKNLL